MPRTAALKQALLASLAFGAVMTLVLGLLDGERGVVTGVVSGLLFGPTLAAFTEYQRRRMEVPGELFEGEPILHQGPANHSRGVEARGGWLLLTSRRLVFRSHGVNLQNAPLEVPLTDIRDVEPTRTLGLVPNGMRVLLRGGASEKFVVQGRAAWLAALSQARRDTPAAEPARPAPTRYKGPTGIDDRPTW